MIGNPHGNYHQHVELSESNSLIIKYNQIVSCSREDGFKDDNQPPTGRPVGRQFVTFHVEDLSGIADVPLHIWMTAHLTSNPRYALHSSPTLT